MSILEKISRFSVSPASPSPEIKNPPSPEIKNPTELRPAPEPIPDRPVVIAILNACRPWCRGCGSMRAKEIATGCDIHLACFCCGQTIDNDPDPDWAPRERVGLCV